MRWVGATPLSQAYADLVSDVRRKQALMRSGEWQKVIWGIPELDKRTGGILTEGYAVLLGKPGTGKTTIAANVAVVNAERGIKVAVWTEEMTPLAYASIVASIRAGIQHTKWRDLQITEEEISKGRFAVGEIGDRLYLYMPEKLDDVPRFLDEYNIRLLIIDYMQFVARRFSGMRDMHTTVGSLSEWLATLGRDHDVSVLVLSSKRRDGDGVSYSSFAEYDVSISLELQESNEMLAGENPGTPVKLVVKKNRFGPKGQDIILSVNEITRKLQTTSLRSLDELAQDTPF